MGANGVGEAGRGRYRIGAVSQITGVPPETLRAWERRYGAVRPQRTDAGFRLYSERDVERLALIKRLSECGSAVGSIALLDREELEVRLARHEQARWTRARELARRVRTGQPVPVVVLDPEVAERLREAEAGTAGIRLQAEAGGVDDLEEALRPDRPAVLVLDLALLDEDPVPRVERLLGRPGVLGAVVRFRFATRRARRQLALAGAHLLRGPADAESLARAVRDAPFVREGARPGASDGEAGAASAPWFSPGELARLAGRRTSAACDCPSHLASLVKSLQEIEACCGRCDDARDDAAAVHARLRRETGAARRILERALAFLVHADGLDA